MAGARTGLWFWVCLFAAGAALYALMAWSAGALNSVRGEWGFAIAAIMLAATIGVDRLLFSASVRQSARELGLGAPQRIGLIAAAVVCAALAAALPLAALLTGATIGLRSDWLWLIPGLLAQAGFAEELMFRGFAYGRVRQGRTFWRAVLLSLPPFVVAHLAMFLTMSWPIALASLALSVIVTPALCHLYELGGRTIWAPALVHAGIQGIIKLVDIEGDSASLLPLAWIAACAALPYLAFIWRRPAD